MKVVASKRELQGTGASRRLRRTGKVPGIIYGTGFTPTPIELDHNELFHALRKESFHSSILELELDGKVTEKVLLRDVQLHAYKPQVMHVDFQRVAANEKIHVKVPLHFVNAESSPAVKLAGAIVSHVITEIDVSCLPEHLPEFIEVDLSGLTVNQSLHVSDLKLPEGVLVVMHENPVLALATVPRGAEEAASVATADSATPAAGAAAPAEKK